MVRRASSRSSTTISKIALRSCATKTADFGDPVFEPHAAREVNGVLVAVTGSLPYTPIANLYWGRLTFGIRTIVAGARRAGGRGGKSWLSHNGMDVDLKMASRVRGIDAILGGHTHDGVPVAVPVSNAGGRTLVTNAGSNGKFLGVMDLRVSAGRVVDARYRLLPVLSNLLPPDAAMDALITRVRAPYEAKLNETLAITDGLLYRRGNFNGSWDQLICDALLEVQGADIALSPGFRWGTSLLAGEAITRELMMDQLAITYPNTTVSQMSGETLKSVLEDVADNLFNPDPYYQQGGDMVRVGGMTYTLTPGAAMGARIAIALRGADRGRQNSTKSAKPRSAKSAHGSRQQAGVETVEACCAIKAGTGRGDNTPNLVGAAGNAGLAG